MSRPLPPAGVGLVADPGLRRSDGGRVLIGGAPLRITRLMRRPPLVLDWNATKPQPQPYSVSPLNLEWAELDRRGIMT